MQLRACSACSHQEIANLGGHKSAEEAMTAFCTAAWGKTRASKWSYTGSGKRALYAFYIFSQPVYKNAGDSRLYGFNFAEFIKKNGFGDVTESPAKRNEAFHPDHDNKLWIWAPDVPALSKWWDDRLKAEEKAAKLAEAERVARLKAQREAALVAEKQRADEAAAKRKAAAKKVDVDLGNLWQPPPGKWYTISSTLGVLKEGY